MNKYKYYLKNNKDKTRFDYRKILQYQSNSNSQTKHIYINSTLKYQPNKVKYK